MGSIEKYRSALRGLEPFEARWPFGVGHADDDVVAGHVYSCSRGRLQHANRDHRVANLVGAAQCKLHIIVAAHRCCDADGGTATIEREGMDETHRGVN